SALEHANVASHTIVLFTSDNGGLATREGPRTPATNNAPLREGKGWLYEGGVRVPLLVRWPGRIAPGVEASLASSVDVLPTIVELCGVSGGPSGDGLSLARLLTEGK